MHIQAFAPRPAHAMGFVKGARHADRPPGVAGTHQGRQYQLSGNALAFAQVVLAHEGFHIFLQGIAVVVI